MLCMCVEIGPVMVDSQANSLVGQLGIQYCVFLLYTEPKAIGRGGMRLDIEIRR